MTLLQLRRNWLCKKNDNYPLSHSKRLFQTQTSLNLESNSTFLSSNRTARSLSFNSALHLRFCALGATIRSGGWGLMIASSYQQLRPDAPGPYPVGSRVSAYYKCNGGTKSATIDTAYVVKNTVDSDGEIKLRFSNTDGSTVEQYTPHHPGFTRMLASSSRPNKFGHNRTK